MEKTLLENVKKYAKKFPSVIGLRVRKLPGDSKKRFVADFTMDGKERRVQFGSPVAKTWIDFGTKTDAAKIKRRSYRARASKIKNKSGVYTYMVPGTANSFAYWLLW